MPTLVRASLLAFALCCPAVAAPVCQYAGIAGAGGETPLANPCLSYGGSITCVAVTHGPAQARLVIVICYPEV